MKALASVKLLAKAFNNPVIGAGDGEITGSTEATAEGEGETLGEGEGVGVGKCPPGTNPPPGGGGVGETSIPINSKQTKLEFKFPAESFMMTFTQCNALAASVVVFVKLKAVALEFENMPVQKVEFVIALSNKPASFTVTLIVIVALA